MIPLYKLECLPRPLRLRKVVKIFAETENRLCTADADSTAAGPAADMTMDMSYFSGVLEMLIRDETFSDAALEALGKARETFRGAGEGSAGDLPRIRRAVNAVRHILLAETGRFPSDWDLVDGEGSLDPARRRPFAGMQVYLEDIRSPFNVGAMFRAAESFGAEKIWLSPLSADPRHKRAERTAMGCAAVLPWERTETIPPGPLFALETGGVDVGRFSFPLRGVLIAGSEELGVSPPVLAAADAELGRVSIPVFGVKGSLNVSVAFGIVMHAWAAARLISGSCPDFAAAREGAV
ncbi:MAG: TrmH family RNA methyltransferase [Treponema sp.]|jgi:TrmH family RNA methyltransferase|nr:TrmH family RNA methyltransferase [Treponema sp.]